MENNKEKLLNSIWNSFHELQGNIDIWNYKEFIFGIIFYRYISEDFTSFMNRDEEGVDYLNSSDSVCTPELKNDIIRTKGYFIFPSELFANVANINRRCNIGEYINSIFKDIEKSAYYHPSKNTLKGLFTSVNYSKLSNIQTENNRQVFSIIEKVKDINIEEVGSFGELFDFLLYKYVSNSGIINSSFFTPKCISKLMTELAISGLNSIEKVYDPTCGSGSSLIQFRNYFKYCRLFGQEINSKMYNLARMNMLIHNINYTGFNLEKGDIFLAPKHNYIKKFDIVISHFPFSQEWNGKDNPMFYYDERFSLPGVLAPRHKADYAFILHNLNYLSDKGRAINICFPSILYRGGAEKHIRKYLVDCNFVEAIIALPSDLFFDTSSFMNLLILSKNKSDKKVQFINATNYECLKDNKNNILMDESIKKIVNLFKNKKSLKSVSIKISNNKIAENDYNLSVNEYLK